MASRIEILDFEVTSFVGCQEKERTLSQPLKLRAIVESKLPFLACETDLLADTLDASEIKNLLVEVSQGLRVRTLEKFASILEMSLRERFPVKGLCWTLSLEKIRKGWTYVHSWST